MFVLCSDERTLPDSVDARVAFLQGRFTRPPGTNYEEWGKIRYKTARAGSVAHRRDAGSHATKIEFEGKRAPIISPG